MVTYSLWNFFRDFYEETNRDIFCIFFGVLFTPFTLLVDVVLIPIEIITLIIYKFIERS